MRLSHNMYSLSIYKNYKTALSQNSQTVADLSSGKKLNSAKDNPNKIGQSENLKISILSREAARNNVQDTDSMLQTFDGSLQEINNNVSRLKQLAVKAANGTISEEDGENIQKEIDGILASIDDLANNTEFNGIKLSQTGTSTAIGDVVTTKTATIGALEDETIDIPFYDMTSDGLDIGDISVCGSSADADGALDKIDAAIGQISKVRSKYGAIKTNLEESLNNFDEINESLTSAQSGLEDTDIATESMKNATNQILIQSGISLMAQSNQLPQDVLNILASI